MSAELSPRDRVVQSAEAWLETPYHHHARVQGVGVDCAQLLIAVYDAAGVIPAVDPGHYAHDWHLHRGEEQFEAWLEHVGAFRVQTPARGDILLFRWGRTFSHGGIYTGDDVVHAYIDLGVVRHRLDEAPINGRVMQAWSHEALA